MIFYFHYNIRFIVVLIGIGLYLLAVGSCAGENAVQPDKLTSRVLPQAADVIVGVVEVCVEDDDTNFVLWSQHQRVITTWTRTITCVSSQRYGPCHRVARVKPFTCDVF